MNVLRHTDAGSKDDSTAAPALLSPTNAAAVLNAAQKRAADQRVTVEQLIERARLLEERLATETEQARIATERLRMAELTAAVAAARAAEREAADRLEACHQTHQSLLNEQAREEDRHGELSEEVGSAENAALAAEAKAAKAQQSVHHVTTAFHQSTSRLDDLRRAIEEVRQQSATAEERLRERRAAREQLDAAMEAAPASLPVGADAMRRVGERRTADEARTANRENVEGVTEVGVCRGVTCARAATAEHIERYPGAGQYCPECGERLEPVERAARDALSPEAYEAFQSRMHELIAGPIVKAYRRRRAALLSLLGALIAVLIAAGFFVFRPHTHGVRAAAVSQPCTNCARVVPAMLRPVGQVHRPPPRPAHAPPHRTYRPRHAPRHANGRR